MKKINKIDVFICKNGFGHAKRQFQIFESLISDLNNLNIVFHLNYDHYNSFRLFIKEWVPLLDLKKISLEFNSMDLSPDYSNKSVYNYSKYKRWLADVKSLNLVSDIIISDNLLGIVNVYPKTILIGSFVWSQITKFKTKNFKKISDFENQILRKKPIMIGIEEIVMSTLKEKTDFIGMPFFVNNKIQKKDFNKSSASILLSIGGTKNIFDKMTSILNIFEDNFDIKIYLDKNLFELTSNKKYNKFNYSDNNFKKLDWIIGRPGVGLINDSIKTLTPIITVVDEDNDEIKHNSDVIKSLGIGTNILDIFIHKNFNSKELVSFLKNSIAKQKFIDKIKQVQIGGISKTSNFLKKILNEKF